MLRNAPIDGQLLQYDTPNWEPLRHLVGDEVTGWFMWMHEVELADGERLQAYKHVATRRYLHVAEDGRTFVFAGEQAYMPVGRRDAVDAALRDWELLIPRPDDMVAVRAALAHVR
jgi:hypothetical protein